MKVINLAAWSGHHFDYPHGALINMPGEIAIPRREAGLVRDATAEELARLEIRTFPGFVDDEEPELVGAHDESAKRRDRRK